MAKTFILACVQNCAGDDMAANIDAASDLVRAARRDGAELIALPEDVALIHPDPKVLRAHAAPAADHRALKTFQALAREVEAWLLVGSLPVLREDGSLANHSFLLDLEGRVVASYEKIHMFDVDLPSGKTYRESATYRSGREAVLAPTPWGLLGLTVCYDLRFPQLYRRLAQAGAQMLSIPSAFTRVTGEAHWHVLVRARAIENGCFVFAPCQRGDHPGNRQTFGHSLIVDPWGRVLADGGEDVGYVSAEIDLARVEEVRAMIPSLRHDRPFAEPKPGLKVAAGP